MFYQASCFLSTVVLSILIRPYSASLPKRRSERCFQEPPIGCFSRMYPFNNTNRLPHSPAFINIHYRHVIRDDSARFHWRDANRFMTVRFRPELETKIIVHGFIEYGDKTWVRELVAEIAKLPEPINIVVLDWRRGARVLTYKQAMANGRVVAAMGALFLNHLISLGADPSTFHVIGNSLGAHVAGDLASRVPGAGRVTGLDPSASLAVGFPPEVRLDPTDALTVDVIHTDGRGPFSYGSLVPMGSVDFYANRGFDQPGCNGSLWEVLLDLFWKDVERCSHSRANKLFMESISTCTILATPCSSLDEITSGKCSKCIEDTACVNFGYHLESNISGLYAFKTSSEPPFCSVFGA